MNLVGEVVLSLEAIVVVPGLVGGGIALLLTRKMRGTQAGRGLIVFGGFAAGVTVVFAVLSGFVLFGN